MHKLFLTLLLFITSLEVDAVVSAASSFSCGDIDSSSSNILLSKWNAKSPFIPEKKDTLFVRDTSYHHLWKRASIWSACIPGAGQFYNELGYRKVQNKRNRAWWKIPLFYGGLGATGYYFYDYMQTAKALKTEWIFRNENGGLTSNPEYANWSDSQLLNGKNSGGITYFGFDDAARYRDIFAFGFVAVWGLQVVEALVDAHFVNFDVSEDLSLSWRPVYYNNQTMGLNVSFRF